MTVNSIRYQITKIKNNITTEKKKTNHTQNKETEDLQDLNKYVVLILKNNKKNQNYHLMNLRTS